MSNADRTQRLYPVRLTLPRIPADESQQQIHRAAAGAFLDDHIERGFHFFAALSLQTISI